MESKTKPETNNFRLKVLEDQYKVVEDNTLTVAKLSTKVSLLLTIMAAIACIVAGGAIYTFTGISDFKVSYANDRIALYQQISDNHLKNKELIEDVNRKIVILETSVDKRFDKIEQNIDKLETKLTEHDVKKR